MDVGIAGRVALVTGASKGLGRASAVALAQEGAKVAICARGADRLRETEAELQAIARSGAADVLAIVRDVTDPVAPAELVAQVVDHFGSIDILVPNAAGPPPMRSLEVDEAAFDDALNGNFKTSARLVQQAVPHMRARRWGRICMITSSSIKQPIPTLSLSNSSRVALWAWAKTAALDLVPDGITLNLACPGTHATERAQSLGLLTGRAGDPADFGDVVAFLCSEQANYITASAVQVDGGEITGLL